MYIPGVLISGKMFVSGENEILIPVPFEPKTMQVWFVDPDDNDKILCEPPEHAHCYIGKTVDTSGRWCVLAQWYVRGVRKLRWRAWNINLPKF